MSIKNEQITRPAVVAVMGHIDHGKSTLLDYIRKTSVVKGEAGGITQRMSAYKVWKKDPTGKDVSITFIDTPGHEAFGALRSRGARVADIAILIVAADEGVKPQTIDALNCIKEAGLPFIVAINKIDRPNANIDKTKQNLAENDIFVEGWGGDIPCIPISAITGEGVEDLFNIILLVSEISEFKANPNVNAEGIIIQAENSKTKGISATLIIKTGTLKSGQCVVSEDSLAPTRIMEDFQGKKITEAGPSDPVRIIGFDKMPRVGSLFSVCKDKKTAEALCEEFKTKNTTSKQQDNKTEEDVLVSIPLIIKASTTDVIEAILHEIKKIKNERVGIKIISTDIGFISERDIKLAMTKEGSIVIGFDTKIDSSAKSLSERSGVRVENFDIIYKMTEWLEEFMKEKTPKVKQEEIHGKMKVLRFFSRTKDKQVIGCRVEEGLVSISDEVKIIRRESEIGKGKIKILQSMKNEVKEVKEGQECGVCIDAKTEIAPGDYLESFTIVEK